MQPTPEHTVELGGHVYRIGRLTPMKQFHVARRLAPLLQSLVMETSGAVDEMVQAGIGLPGSLGSAAKEPAKDQDAPTEGDEAGADEESGTMRQLMSYIGPLLMKLAEMSDEETEYVLKTCLSACSRQQERGFAPVVTAQGDFMFMDITLVEMLNLTREVVQTNLADFFPVAPTQS